MATPLPTSGTLPRLNSCLSSDFGSEENDAFPNALTLDAAHAPDQSTVPRSAPQRVLELNRKDTGSLMSGGESSVREQTNVNPASASASAASAAATAAAATAEKADCKRTPVRPAEVRSSASIFSERGRAMSRKLSGKLSNLLGLRGSRSGEPAQWKPHETILKALGHRPAGYGRPFTDSYTLGGVLGTGGFGIVREGTHKPDGEVYAVKVMSREAVSSMDALEQEVGILRRLHHHQVVRFIDFYEEPQNFFLVLEKVPGGEMFDRIIAEGRFREEDAKGCMRSLLGALAYCHSQNVAHRDIKPENILFASLDAHDRTVKLADFGLARSVAEGPVNGPPCGTPTYMAPESLKMLPHGTQVDCWGVGVVTHVLLGGYAPFASSRTEKLFRLIKKGHVSFDDACWGSVSQRAKDFILAHLQVDPDARLTPKQALRHPWLAEEKTGGDGHDLAPSVANLRVFCAKRKFRAAIHTLIACQQLQRGRLPISAGVVSTPASPAGVASTTVLPGGGKENGWGNGRVGTRSTFGGPQSPMRVGFDRPHATTMKRKGTGLFNMNGWRESVITARQTSVLARATQVQRQSSLAEEMQAIVARRIADEEMDEETSSSSEQGQEGT